MGRIPVANQQPANPPLASIPVLIITGVSGSGKSTVLRALEDIGYFCVDNLPLRLLPPFLREQSRAHRDGRKIALVMDVRTEGFLQNYARVFRSLKKQGYQLHLIFLEADEATLIRRFSQTRRQHPLADQESISHALIEERRSLAGLRSLAHRIIDSSFYSPHQLRDLIQAEYSELTPRQRLALHLISFSYKNGIPPESDLVLDVRFLPNPFFVEDLKPLTGNDPRVRDYVLGQQETQSFLQHLFDFLDYLLPLFIQEGKTHLTLAIGCTGGQHRSVVIANVLAEHLTQGNLPFTLHHREVTPKESYS
ncbi:MAG: RNase adapter RapZ [Deltaproteobacteria bacterium]|nr:RNase adapter RapZ [Deltaproteobacteria bacterium]MBI4795487.1 RNase adapter RapZ [Deltaproteobacteria bacterium]